MLSACVRTSSIVLANFTPPALPRPPILTCDFTITGVPSRVAASTASSTVRATMPAGAGTPCAANSSFAWYSYRSTCSPNLTVANPCSCPQLWRSCPGSGSARSLDFLRARLVKAHREGCWAMLAAIFSTSWAIAGMPPH